MVGHTWLATIMDLKTERSMHQGQFGVTVEVAAVAAGRVGGAGQSVCALLLISHFS